MGIGECMFDISKGCVSPTAIIISTILWYIIMDALKFGSLYLLEQLYGRKKVDPSKAYLPAEFPLEFGPGATKPWTKRVTEVSEAEIESFLTFRCIPDIDELTLKEKQKKAAKEAVKYRNELFDKKFFRYIDDKFLQNKKVPYPLQMPTWNPNAWFSEVGHQYRYFFCGNLAYAIQHFSGGLLAFLSLKQRPKLIRLMLYSDIGFNLVDLILMGISLIANYDFTMYAGNRRMNPEKGDPSMKGLYRLLMAHHLGAALIEIGALAVNADPRLSAEVAIALLGTTGALHSAATLTDFMPIRDDINQLFPFTAFVFFAMLYYRAFLWVFKYIPQILRETLVLGGPIVAVGAAAAVAIFTAFNVDFIRFYYSKTRKLYEKYLDENKIEFDFMKTLLK